MLDQSVSGDGAIGVQVDGNDNVVAVYAGATRLHLEGKHRNAGGRPPANESELLRVDFRATTLLGRDTELDALDAWRASPRPIAVQCLTGRAGSGKTRLAIEACARAAADKWIAGFVAGDELARFNAQQNLAAWRAPGPVLIVVDDAAAAQTTLRAWLSALARRKPEPTDPPLRILLLERFADADQDYGWWAELRREGSLDSLGPRDLIDPPRPFDLPVLPGADLRRALLAETVRFAAAIQQRPAPPLPAPDTDKAFDARLADGAIETEPLFLMMAGIVAVEKGVKAAVALGRADLAARVASRERARLDALAAGWGVPNTVVAHLAACVTLQRGCPAGAAAALVAEEVAAMNLAPGIDAERIAGHLIDALPAPGSGIGAIKPDLIGEAFLVPVIKGPPTRSEAARHAIVARACARDRMAVVTTLVQTAQDLAEGRADYDAVAWLRRFADECVRLNDLIVIADSLPESSLVFREFAAHLGERITDSLRAVAQDEPRAVPTLAVALNNLGRMLSALGRREDALAAADEAVTLRRALAAARPDALNPDLATSLNNLAIRLSDLGRREDALAVAEEAVKIYRALAAARPGTFASDLAASLNNLANRLRALGRREDALAAAEEAVTLYRALAAARADAFTPNLAGSVSNLANMLSALGRREDALAAAEEAVTLHRALAAARPDAFTPDLATSLNNLAIRLSDLGRREDALAVAEEAVTLRRALAAARPDTFTPDLAMSLNNLAAMLSSLGRREDALAVADEAVTLRRALAATRPDAFAPDLAASLNNLANRLSDLGRREDALAVSEEAMTHYRALAAARPDVFIPDLAGSVSNLANVLSDLGCREDALAAAEEAVTLYRALAATRPDAFTPDLAMSLNNLANMLSDLGRREDALAVAEEAVTLRRALAAARPDTFTPDLAMSLNNLAAMLSSLGRREDALAVADEAVTLRRALAMVRPDAFTPDLAGSLNNLASILNDLGRRDDGLTAADEAVTLYRTLVIARPDAFTSDLARSLSVLGDQLEGVGHVAEAVVADQESVAALAPYCLASPAVFAQPMLTYLRDYLRRAKLARIDVDVELVMPIIDRLKEAGFLEGD